MEREAEFFEEQKNLEKIRELKEALEGEAFVEKQEKTIRVLLERINRYMQNSQNDTEHKLIDGISWRVKGAASAAGKLWRKGLEISYENALHNLNDLIGLRIVCPFCDDVYKIADFIKKQPDFELVKVKDYVSQPKKSGYQSIHLILDVPVDCMGHAELSRVEIQIRSLAMNLWAKLDHQLSYKQTKLSAKQLKEVRRRLSEYAKEIMRIDESMVRIRDEIRKL